MVSQDVQLSDTIVPGVDGILGWEMEPAPAILFPLYVMDCQVNFRQPQAVLKLMNAGYAESRFPLRHRCEVGVGCDIASLSHTQRLSSGIVQVSTYVLAIPH